MSIIRFDGQIAIVTGAARGIGRCHALGLAARGAKVVVVDFGGSEAAGKVVQEIEASGGSAVDANVDVSDADAVQRMVDDVLKRWGRVDVLVNNAGILIDKSFAKMDLPSFRKVVDVHLMGSAYCAKAVWAAMREQNYGRILFTSSGSGLYGNFGQANYGTAKAGMLGLMNVLHLEGEKYDIRVNMLLPSAATGMTAGLLSEQESASLRPESVTPGVLYLVSKDAPSRTMLAAGAGTFAKVVVLETAGVHLDTDQCTPEEVARRFADISDLSGARSVATAFDQVSKLVAAAGRAGK